MGLRWVTRSPVRMLVVIAVLVGLPVMVLGQLLADSSQKTSRDVEMDRVSDGAAAGAEVISERVSSLLAQTKTIAESDELPALMIRADEPELENYLGGLLPLYVRDARRLFILDVTGRFMASAPPQRALRGTDFGRTDYFVGSANPWRAFVSQVYSTTEDQPPEATIAVPIRDQSGTPIGLLCAAIDLGRAATWLSALTFLYDEIYIVDPRGHL